MASRGTSKVEVEITAVDDASPKIDKLQSKIDGLEADEARIKVSADISKMDAQLSDALAKLHNLTGDEYTVQARLVGTLEDDLIDARKLLDQLDGQTGTVKLDANTSDFEAGAKRAADSTDELSHSARGANSALANMIGNTTQDLGELGGIVGSLGVGIGQMGEYAADAALDGESLAGSLGSMAAVAGPIAALSLVTAGLTWYLNRGKAEAKEIAEATQDYADALFDAQDNAKSLAAAADQVTKSRVDDFIKGLGGDTDDFADALDAAGLSYDDLIRAFGSGDGRLVDAIRRYRDLRDETAMYRAQLGDEMGVRQWATAHHQNADAAVEEWNTLKTLNDEIGKNIDVSQQAQANAEAAARIRERESTAVALTADALAALNTQQQLYVESLTQMHDAAEDQQRLVDAAENHADAIARVNVEAERVDRARIVAKEREEVEKLRSTYSRLRDDLSDRRTLLQLQNDFETLRTKAEDAWTAASEGADDAEQKQRDYQIAQLDTIDNALAYLDTLDRFPDKVTTDIEALIDRGAYNEALGALEVLTKPRTIELQAHLDELAIQRQIRAAYAKAGLPSAGPTSAPVSFPTATGGTFVTVNLPRGSRGADVVRTLTGQTRRSGRRYGAPVVHYARR